MKSKEAALQSQCIKWFRYQCPNEIIFAIPNGGSRNIIEASNLKRQGVLAGVPDLFLAKSSNGYNGLFIEFKYGNGKLTSSQIEVIERLSEHGYKCEVCKSFDSFLNIVKNYIN